MWWRFEMIAYSLQRGLDEIVDSLCEGSAEFSRGFDDPKGCLHPLPSRHIVTKIIDELRSVLFPGFFGTADLTKENIRYHIGSTLDTLSHQLEEQIRRGLCFQCPECSHDECAPEKMLHCQERAREITNTFLAKLPKIQKLLAGDVIATYQGDPAATSPAEAIFCYPGILAMTSYRIAHELYNLKVPILPRIITEQAHSLTGIDIHPGAQIGERFCIDHGTGIVIGETTIIGNDVKIYQGVTLGAKSFPLDENGKPIKGIPRHPIVEDNVIIYSGATILGRVTIGRGSVIGGNVWLTYSVPPNSKITQARSYEEYYRDGAGI